MQGNDVTAEMLAEASIGAYAQDGPENYEDYLLYTVEAQGKIKHAGADPGYKDSAALQDSAQAAVLISEQSPLIDLAGARGIIALSPSSLESMLKSMSEEYSLG